METMNTSVESMPMFMITILVSLVLVGYDYLLTLGPEIQRFWSGKFYHRPSFSSLLFFGNRYLALLGFIPIAVGFLSRIGTNPTSCKYFLIYGVSLLTTLQTIIGCMMLRRIRALYGLRAGLLAFTTVLSICSITVVVLLFKHPKHDMPRAAFGNHCIITTVHAYYLVGLWTGEFLFDAVIFALTLYKALTLPRGHGMGLLEIITRDGVEYFGVMATLNLANILVLVFAPPPNNASMTVPTSVMSSIMMTRLMLNLRDPQLSGGAEEFKTTTVNIGEFNRQMRPGTSSEYSRNSQRDESSV